MSNARLYPFWGDLTEALQSGKPQNEKETEVMPLAGSASAGIAYK